MKKATTICETYILLSQASKITTIPKGTISYYAVKRRTRFYKFSGRRWIEKGDLICLLNSIKLKRTQSEQIAIDAYIESLGSPALN